MNRRKRAVATGATLLAGACLTACKPAGEDQSKEAK
jgi:hypothetical protein